MTIAGISVICQRTLEKEALTPDTILHQMAPQTSPAEAASKHHSQFKINHDTLGDCLSMTLFTKLSGVTAVTGQFLTPSTKICFYMIPQTETINTQE